MLLLGALALGDIGQHFPDTDVVNAGLDSRIILRSAYDLMKEEGYHLVNADITYCERQITPHSRRCNKT